MSLGLLADIDFNITATLFSLSRSLAFILHRCVRDFDERLMISFTHSCDFLFHRLSSLPVADSLSSFRFGE